LLYILLQQTPLSGIYFLSSHLPQPNRTPPPPPFTTRRRLPPLFSWKVILFYIYVFFCVIENDISLYKFLIFLIFGAPNSWILTTTHHHPPPITTDTHHHYIYIFSYNIVQYISFHKFLIFEFLVHPTLEFLPPPHHHSSPPLLLFLQHSTIH